jgi:hypothetical protein
LRKSIGAPRSRLSGRAGSNTLQRMGARQASFCAGAALVLAGCVAPTLAEYQGGRSADLDAIRALPADARAQALRDRILRDGVVLRDPVWSGVGLDANGTPFDCHAQDFKCLYLVAPLRQYLAEDYLALGEVLRERGDGDGAIGAYEDAVHLADTIVLSAAAAARIRAAALRGEEKLWLDRKEPLRARAASVVAKAEEAWARTPEAEALERQYQELLGDSRGAMQRDIDQAAQASLDTLQRSLAAAQSLSELQGVKRNAGAAASLAAVAGAARRIGPLLAAGVAGTKSTDEGLVAFVREVVGAAIDPAQLESFDGGEAGKRAIVDVLASLQTLRRGDSVERARTLMTAALATVRAAPPDAAPPALDVAERLKRVDDLHEKHLLTDEEYQKQRQRILEGL